MCTDLTIFSHPRLNDGPLDAPSHFNIRFRLMIVDELPFLLKVLSAPMCGVSFFTFRPSVGATKAEAFVGFDLRSMQVVLLFAGSLVGAKAPL